MLQSNAEHQHASLQHRSRVLSTKRTILAPKITQCLKEGQLKMKKKKTNTKIQIKSQILRSPKKSKLQQHRPVLTCFTSDSKSGRPQLLDFAPRIPWLFSIILILEMNSKGRSRKTNSSVTSPATHQPSLGSWEIAMKLSALDQNVPINKSLPSHTSKRSTGRRPLCSYSSS